MHMHQAPHTVHITITIWTSAPKITCNFITTPTAFYVVYKIHWFLWITSVLLSRAVAMFNETVYNIIEIFNF